MVLVMVDEEVVLVMVAKEVVSVVDDEVGGGRGEKEAKHW